MAQHLNNHSPERTTSRADKMSGDKGTINKARRRNGAIPNFGLGRFGKKFQNKKRRQYLKQYDTTKQD